MRLLLVEAEDIESLAGERFTIRGMGRAESLDEISQMAVAIRRCP